MKLGVTHDGWQIELCPSVSGDPGNATVQRPD